jgi:hypothetical protein
LRYRKELKEFNNMNNQLKNVLFIFKMVMSLVYITIGLTFIFKNELTVDIISPQYAPILGALFIVFGLFRGYRAYTIERQ